MLPNHVVSLEFTRVSSCFMVMEHLQNILLQGKILHNIQFVLILKDVVIFNSFNFLVFEVRKKSMRCVLFQGEVNMVNTGVNVLYFTYSLLQCEVDQVDEQVVGKKNNIFIIMFGSYPMVRLLR